MNRCIFQNSNDTGCVFVPTNGVTTKQLMLLLYKEFLLPRSKTKEQGPFEKLIVVQLVKKFLAL